MSAAPRARALARRASAGRGRRPAQPPRGARPPILRDVGFDQRLGEPVPLDLALPRRGGPRRCGSATTSGGRPVVLALVYYDCPMLCTLVLNGLASALDVARLRRRQRVRGRHGQLRPARDAGAGARPRRRPTSQRYGRPGAAAGWHFLTGDAGRDRARSPTRSASATPGTSDDRQFAHPAGIVVLTPEGPHRALPLRHRVRAQGPAPRPGRGRRSGRIGTPVDQAPALLLPLRPRDRALQRRRS